MKKIIIIKIGSNVITQNGLEFNRNFIKNLGKQIVNLRKSKPNHKIVIVSSGAIAEGVKKLGWKNKPKNLPKLQAAAAVGQLELIWRYQNIFTKMKLDVAQVLLTHQELSNRTQYLNARKSIMNLIDLNIIPIINENDVVATEEIQFSDNDHLAALVCNLIEAEKFIIITDQKGLFDKNPEKYKSAKLIEEIEYNNPLLNEIDGSSKSSWGKGGIKTKINACIIASKGSTKCYIISADEKNFIEKIINDQNLGTTILPKEKIISSRKQWLQNLPKSKGEFIVDNGAKTAITKNQKSLLPVGVKKVIGNFIKGDLIIIKTSNGKEIARGLVNYSSEKANLIKGLSSKEINSKFGQIDEESIINKDNLVVLDN